VCSRRRPRKRRLHQSRVCVKLLSRPSLPRPLGRSPRFLYQHPPASLGCPKVRSCDFGQPLGKQWPIPRRRWREGFCPSGRRFSNWCVLPLLLRPFFPHTIVNRSTVLALPLWNPHRSLAPLRGRAGFTSATRGYKFEQIGNSHASLPTRFSDHIPHLFGTVRNSKRNTVLARYNHRLQTGRRHGLLGVLILYSDDVKSPSSLEGTTTTQITNDIRLPGKNIHLRYLWKVCVRRCRAYHDVGRGLCVFPVGRETRDNIVI